MVVLLAACGPPPLEFADWLIDVPEGTAVHEYAPVPMEQRDANAIRLSEELVVGADLGNPDEAVFQPGPIAAADDGTMFVADFATTRVQMYDNDGRFVRSLGSEGQGPGELASISSMTIAGGMLVIDDSRGGRWSLWTIGGEHVGDQRKPEGVAGRSMNIEGLGDGSIVARSAGSFDGGDRRLALVVRLDLEGRELARFDEIAPGRPIIPDRGWTAADITAALMELISQPTRRWTAGAEGFVFVSPVDEYQVHCFAPDGSTRWALRVAGPRPAMSSHVRGQLLSMARSMDEAVVPSQFDWPPGDDAVEELRTDGAGRLYVILKTHFEGTPPDQLPVDVYSSEGNHVAAGFMPVRWREGYPLAFPAWDHAVGEHVYGRRENEAGELVAVRYRLTVTENE